MRFTLNKTIDPLSGFSADDDPNVTEPPSAEVTPMNQGGRGHAVSLHFMQADGVTPVPAATLNFTTWYKNKAPAAEGGGVWHRLQPETDAAYGDTFKSSTKSDIFVQLQAVGSLGLATILRIFVGERESV